MSLFPQIAGTRNEQKTQELAVFFVEENEFGEFNSFLREEMFRGEYKHLCRWGSKKLMKLMESLYHIENKRCTE